MKKVLTAVVSIISVMIICFSIAGCATNVAGKTFVFSDIEVSYDADLSETEKKAVEFAISAMKDTLKGTEYSFSAEDDTVNFKGIKYGTYVQEGSKLTITVAGQPNEIEVKGNSLRIGKEEGKNKLYLIYVAK